MGVREICWAGREGGRELDRGENKGRMVLKRCRGGTTLRVTKVIRHKIWIEVKKIFGPAREVGRIFNRVLKEVGRIFTQPRQPSHSSQRSDMY